MKLKMKIAAAVILMSVFSLGAESKPNTNIEEWRCNANSYSQTDAYAANVEYVLADLVAITPNTGMAYFTQSPSKTDICYGYASCGTNKAPLTSKDCADCLSANRAAVMDICSSKIGAMVEMVDCVVRYENYRFY